MREFAWNKGQQQRDATLISPENILGQHALRHSGQPDYWQENSRLFLERHPYLRVKFDDRCFRQRVHTGTLRGRQTRFDYATENMQGKRFYSWSEPVKEARQWAAQIPADDNAVFVILGGGLFYHVLEALQRIPDSQPVVVIERDEDAFAEALRAVDLSPLFQRKNLTIWVGEDVSEAAQCISTSYTGTSLERIHFLSHRPSVQIFPDFYDAVVRVFTRLTRKSMQDRLRYAKFCQAPERALLLTTKYFLMGEVVSAMRRLGMRFQLVTIDQEEMDGSEFIEEVSEKILQFRPDFLFTINHLGLDREGVLAQFLNEIEMPFASWYVDNPSLLLPHYQKKISPFCVLFLWDRETIPEMKKLGFEHIFYMPLGVDEQRFRPLAHLHNPLAHLACDVGFIGNSMVKKTRARLLKADVDSTLTSCFKEIARSFSHAPSRSVEDVLQRQFPGAALVLAALSEEKRSIFQTAVTWEATRQYRMERIEKLLPFTPTIVGDPGWNELFDAETFRYGRELSYYDEVPYFYNVATINFNATSRQMKGAVNQRVFDVPACNRFLLTDYQEQIEELFEVGKEVVCYRDPGEIEGLVRYYLREEEERMHIAQRGYARAIRDHTYVSRIEMMVKTMRAIFGR